MKIAIDIGPTKSEHSFRGIGIYTQELLKALRIEGVDVKNVDLSKYDVVHFTSFKPFEISLPFTKPEGVKFVLTVYDLIPLIYPEHYPPGLRGWINWQVNKFLIEKNVDAVITISETSKKDIVRFLGINPNKISVIYLAPRRIFRRIINTSILYSIEVKYKLPKKFALYAGDINYNKNIPVLIGACKIAKIPLVVVGKQAKEIEKMNLDHAELGHLNGINWSEVMRLGYVPDEDLVALYNLASIYIQPSFYEGFGLPVLEAFASGTPVVASRTQALVEIGKAVCLFADPKDPKDLANKIKQVIDDGTLGEQLVNTGLILVKKFSWTKTASETLEVYKHV